MTCLFYVAGNIDKREMRIYEDGTCKRKTGNDEGRLEKEIRVYDLLDFLNIPYERIDHEAAETMEACAEIDRALAPR